MISTPTLPDIDRIRAASRRIVRQLGFLRGDLAESGLPPSAVHALIEIGMGSATTGRDLSAVLGLEKSSVSRMLAKLQQQGLVRADTDAQDPRLKRLALSEAGLARFRQIESFGRRQVQGALADLPHEARQQVRLGLETYAAALEPPAPTAPVVTYGSGYLPGLLARVVELHAGYYSRAVGFGLPFECLVASEMAAFLGRLDESPVNACFHARRGAEILGSVSIEAKAEGSAHLRWFILADGARGLGIGRALLGQAMAHVDALEVPRVELWTFAGLDAARHLYESQGFALVEEQEGARWGRVVREQRFVREMAKG